MKLDKNLEIRNLLLDKIERGEWRPGAKLPGARQLAGEVGCCFTHLQSVLESLVQQGILLSVPRSGTYVRENWEKRLLQGTLRLHRAAPEDCTRQVYSAPISQEHPELRLTWKFDRAVYEIQVSHYLLGHHSQYLDLGPIFRKLYPDPSAFFPAPFRQFLVNGKLCGIPLLFSPRIIAYNRELFKQCGVELPRPGWSWEEFIACIRQLRSKLPAERVFPFNHALYEFYPIAARFGGRIIDLTPLSCAQLTALMQAFAHGYRALQAQPEVPDALLRVNSLLTGAPLTREEMLALWSHLDADDAEALGAAFDACRSRSLEAPIKPPQLKTGDGCTFAPLTPVHIELRQNEVNWYNRVFGWLPFVDSADDIRRENRRLQNEYRAAQRASDLSFGGNPFEDEIEYSDAVLKPRYRLHRCGLPKERLAIPAQPAAPGRERPLDRKGILSLLLDDRREHTPEQELFLTYVKELSGVQRIVDGYLGKSQSALVKNLRSNPDSFARTIMQTIYSDARRNGIDHLPSLARELIEPELRRHEAARPKPSPEPKSEE